jgi:hypothetical protein
MTTELVPGSVSSSRSRLGVGRQGVPQVLFLETSVVTYSGALA